MATDYKILPILQAALRDAEFLRYNIPEELAQHVRPLSTKEAKELNSLSYLYKTGSWSDQATAKLMELRQKTDIKARTLEQLLKDNGYVIRYSNVKEKMVVASKSPYGTRVLFTWQLPEYEEYDAGKLKEINEDEFLKELIAGKYDDKYDKEYLSQMYPKKELREGVERDGDEYRRFFLMKNSDDVDDEDNTEAANSLRIFRPGEEG